MRTIVPMALGLTVIGGHALAGQFPQRFTNLQVLPEDIDAGRLIQTMRGFADALGVRCNFCHVGTDPDDLSDYDFPADEKATKRMARRMVAMTRSFNAALDALPSPPERRVECYTCHRGTSQPEQLRDALLRAYQEGGIPSLTRAYDELRERYYGRAVYDFGEVSLLGVAEALERRHDAPRDALRVLDLNLRHYPTSFFTHFQRANITLGLGDTASALRSLMLAEAADTTVGWASEMIAEVVRAGGERRQQ